MFEDGQIYNIMCIAYLKPIINKSGYAYVTLCKNKLKSIRQSSKKFRMGFTKWKCTTCKK